MSYGVRNALSGPSPRSRSLKCIECLVSVADEGQAHLGVLVDRNGFCLGAVHGAVVLLRNFLDREVTHIDIRRQLWLEWSPNLAKFIPLNSSEEWVSLDRRGTVMSPTIIAQTVFGITQKAVFRSALGQATWE